MLLPRPLLNFLTFVSVASALFIAGDCLAQQDSGNSNWTTTTQQQDPNGGLNPSRTRQTHTEADGKTVDRKSVEVLGPDGGYVPYSNTETEAVKVDSTTVRTTVRSYGMGPDGQRVLVQVREEESRNLPGGDQKVTRTISNPDANGKLQPVQREQQESRLVSPSERQTKTTVLNPNVDGVFTPTVQIEEQEKKSGDGTVEFKKSTSLPDGDGHWQTSEVRQGKISKDGQGTSKEESVLRPDADGKLAVAERTISKQSQAPNGEKRDTIESYSTSVPGMAGGGGPQLVQREMSSSQVGLNGQRTSTRQIEQPTPGSPEYGLHVTQKTIDIIRPGTGGTADQTKTIMSSDSDGRLREVWVDMGKTDNPAVVNVDTNTAAKPKQ